MSKLVQDNQFNPNNTSKTSVQDNLNTVQVNIKGIQGSQFMQYKLEICYAR